MRVALLVAVAGALVAGLAEAATISGTSRAERLRGTARADLILGRGGRDTVLGQRGDDRVAVQYDGAVDAVRCGPGRDIVNADPADRVDADCEVVSRMLSRDTYTNPESTHESQAEPDSLAFGSTIVATFQTGRRFDGGASDIGWATSTNGGRTWRRGHLPTLTVNSRPPGSAALASDPVVGYDARHGVWLISTLATAGRVAQLPIHRSTDGLRWTGPVIAAHAETPSLAYDKNWLACDNWPQSPRFGRCYLAYTDHIGNRPKLAVQFSDDGGATWSAQVIAVRDDAVGVIPSVRPDGSLVVPYLGDDRIQAVVSRDGGATFAPPAVIAQVQAARVPRVRAFPLPAVDVGADGRVYVVWQDCRFRTSCTANDIALSTSADGSSWSAPARITPGGGNAHVPAIAVDAATGRLALAYHTLNASARIDVWLRTSRNGGRTWTRPQRLSAQSMPLPWLPNTTSGRMLGDYIAVSWVGTRTVTVYALASEPRGGKLRQAIFATQPLR